MLSYILKAQCYQINTEAFEMSRKEKVNKDGSITVTLNGRDNAKFWAAVDAEAAQWIGNGYDLVHIEKGGNLFKDSFITTLLNMFRTILGKEDIHDPIVKMTFAK